jgi:hypothetical protein
MSTQTRTIPKLSTRAAFVPSTLNEEARTVELTWSTGARVLRTDWWTETQWVEELSMNPEHVRLDRLNAGAPLLPDHNGHSIRDVLGVVEKAWLVGNEGRALVRFSERADVQPILQDVKSGILRNISVGYKVNQFEEQAQRQNDLKVYRATDWEPMEISLVTIPADASAQIRSDSDHQTIVINQPEAITMPETTEQTREQPAAPPINVEEISAQAAKAERQRQAEIRQFAKFAGTRINPAAIDDLIERGVTVEAAKEAIMKTWSTAVDGETTRSDTSVTTDSRDKFIEAGVQAIRARAGLEKMEGQNEFRGMRLTELAKACLERSGESVRGMSELEMVKRSFTQSTSDFPVLLENAMHKTLQTAYATAPDSWRRFCGIGSVTDFRAQNRYRTGSFGNLDSLSELSEFKNKSIPDGEKASITASTKGNLINISRQTIINDDLNAFMSLTQMLGRAAARTIEADVFALLAANPTMPDGIALFHSSHSNLAGSGAAVSVTTLEAARQALASQKDISGNDYLDLRPALWLGGLASGGIARVANDAQYDPDTANKLQMPNRVRGLFRDVIDTPRITGTEWYMFADPLDAPVFEVAFLNGEQAPYLEQEVGFDVDGVRWKVRLDYGVAAIDWRGAYKNAGA